MALSDILERIATDAEGEAARIRAQAEDEAERIRAEARERAEEIVERIVREAERDAARQAETIVASAHLAARNEALAAKGGLLDEALDKLETSVVALPDADYTAFLARRIAQAARGDERVLVAAADRERLAGLARAVSAEAAARGRELALVYSDEPAPVPHGVVLEGQRDSVDLSIDGIIDSVRDELEVRLAKALFGGGKDD
ncbi:MAG: V-type ATP synthase subunit E [Actinomycetia bacterium]|nr:V-type ATP synthase subunit E [Actinomycetes bacterium]